MPPQFLPNDPTIAAYVRVWDSLPIASFFLNSATVAVATGLLNVLVAAMAAYPLAKMRFGGRDFVFYLLLATLIVPAQLTYIPSFILAVNVFHYYDSLPALIFPNIVERVQHLPAAPGLPGRARRPASTRPVSMAPGSGGSGGRSCCRSSGRRWRRSRSSRS